MDAYAGSVGYSGPWPSQIWNYTPKHISNKFKPPGEEQNDLKKLSNIKDSFCLMSFISKLMKIQRRSLIPIQLKNVRYEE